MRSVGTQMSCAPEWPSHKEKAELRKLLLVRTILMREMFIFLKDTCITKFRDYAKRRETMARQPTAQKKTSKPESKGKLMSFERKTKGQQKEPKPPFPKQHQPRPGIEGEIEPRPKYKAPLYRGADKLLD